MCRDCRRDGDAQRRRSLLAGTREPRQQVGNLAFEEPDAIDMSAELRAGRGRETGLTALDQHGADTLFKAPDALGDRGGRDTERARGPLETAFAHHRRQRREHRVIQHGISSASST